MTRRQYDVLDAHFHPFKIGAIVRVYVNSPHSRTAERGARRTAVARMAGKGNAKRGTSLLRKNEISPSTTLYTVHVF